MSDPKPALDDLLEAERNHVMSDEEKEEQRRSWAHGNVSMSNPNVTRELVDREAEDWNQSSRPSERRRTLCAEEING